MARLRFGVYVHQDGPKIGRGKIALLLAVKDHGSISAAARSMGMAYRHAWQLIDELNHSFDEPVVVSSAGGARGGGARLTAWGEELIARFDEMERAVAESLDEHLTALDARCAETPPIRPGRPRRRPESH